MSKSQIKLGFHRDRMSVLLELRKHCNFNAYPSQMGAGLIDPDSSSPSRGPSIVQQMTITEQKVFEVESQMRELQELYSRRIAAVTSFNDETQIESEIEAKTKQISQALFRLKNHIETTRTLNVHSLETKQIQDNIKKGYLSKLRDLTIKFREMQCGYLNKLKSLQSMTDGSSLSIDNDSMELEEFNVSFTGEQNAMVMEHEMANQRRNEEIMRLIQQIDQVKQLFLDLASLIQEQGTILDRIDNFIETAVNEVQKGNEELEKAEKHQKNKCFYVYLIGMIVLILILGTVILIRKAKKSKNDNEENNDSNNDNTNSSSLIQEYMNI